MKKFWAPIPEIAATLAAQYRGQKVLEVVQQSPPFRQRWSTVSP